MTPYGVKTPGEQDIEGEDYFQDQKPMFVDLDEEDEEEGDVLVDEGQVKRLLRARLGGWMDWAVGWMDFGVDEQQEDDDEEEEEEAAAESAGVEKEIEPSIKGRWIPTRREREKEQAAQEQSTSNKVGIPPPKGDSALGDAAWLLNVAAKSLA